MPGRIDSNQRIIVRDLRNMGYTVCVLSDVGKGCPDIVVGIENRNFLFEIKDGSRPPSKQALTTFEQQWHAQWRGQVDIIRSAKEAADIIRNHLAGRTAG